jgi:glycerol-3-phosphate dehydrogenase (NAD(P)+)
MNIAILGAGAWGTAMAVSLANRHRVLLWGRETEQIVEAEKSRVNNMGLPGVKLPDSLHLTGDFALAANHGAGAAGLVIVATSVAGLRPVLTQIKDYPVKNVIWLCKGFERDTGLLPSQVAGEVIQDMDINLGVLSGPSFAQEVAAGLPCALTVASKSEVLRGLVIGAMNAGMMRIYSSDDVVGVEVGGALKNILAVATGIADGLSMGLNARAALMTRGLAEITRMGIALGGRLETFMGLTGVGDLILTCTGDLSRNRRVGLGLAKGKTLKDVVAELGHVAEGVNCAHTVRELASKMGVEMPLTNAVASVLFDDVSIKEAIALLMSRHVRDENDVLYRQVG